MDSIFVQIASYRDSELIPTIKHCLERAKKPERLNFAICWQHDENEDIGLIKELIPADRLQILDHDYRESKGACWARHKLNNVYSGEKFFLQLDSHHRFVEGWDEKIVEYWNLLNDSNAIITGYPPNYGPNLDESKWYNVPQICNVYKFDHKYTVSRPADLKDWKNKTKPVRGIYISAGFIFGPGKAIIDVPYDPDFYFSGEECAMAIRFFTNGYNLYNSHRVIVYHFYQRLECKKHWSDHSNWGSYDIKAHDRLDCLLGRNKKYDLGRYGLGTVRTLEDYRKYAGIDFVNRIVHREIASGIEPPCSNSNEGWDNELVKFDEIISWDYTKVDKCDDPRFWAMIVKDQDNIAIYREDLPYNKYQEIINGIITSKKFIFDRAKNRQIPKTLLIWPYSETKKWLKPSTFPIL